MSKPEDRLRQYEKMIKRNDKDDKNVPGSCKKCQYYRPDFKFRKCLYTKCQFGKEQDVFRKKPLKSDKFSNG